MKIADFSHKQTTKYELKLYYYKKETKKIK